MSSSIPIRFFLIVCTAVICMCVLNGCNSTGRVTSGTYQALYDYESYYLHPEVGLYHFRNDSSEIHFLIRSEELLYAKSESLSFFEAQVRLMLLISRDNNPGYTDTIEFVIHDFRNSDQGKWLYGSHRFPLGEGLWTIRLQTTDLNRGVNQELILNADKSSLFTAQNYLVRRKKDRRIVLSSFATAGDTLTIESARNTGSGLTNPAALQISYISDPVKLPPPPFSSNEPDIPQIEEALKYSIDQKAGLYTVIPKEGISFCSLAPESGQGIFLSVAPSGYPGVYTNGQLIWPLRYITSKTEFDEISKNNFPKALIDNFWIECAGSKERARELIRAYYSRVEEANRYFSSYTEGWRTDRGMIHLLFGNPGRIKRTESTETWIYGQEGNSGSISFLFQKRTNPLSDNVYVLQRDPMFRQPWEEMVTTWRQGRVFGE